MPDPADANRSAVGSRKSVHFRYEEFRRSRKLKCGAQLCGESLPLPVIRETMLGLGVRKDRHGV